MKSIAGQTCPLCLSAGHPVRYAEGVPLRECNTSHPAVLLSWCWPSESEYEQWYATDEYHHAQYQKNRGVTCEGLWEECKVAALARLKVLDTFLPAVPGARLLDVGAGNMAFVDCARECGYDAHGIDPHPTREDCIVGGWRQVRGRWDVLTLHDVAEHLTRPLACFTFLRECLSPNGIMVVEMPEYGSPGSDRHIKTKEHICLYSRGAAEELYERAGLKVEAFYRPLRGSISKMAHYLSRGESLAEVL